MTCKNWTNDLYKYGLVTWWQRTCWLREFNAMTNEIHGRENYTRWLVTYHVNFAISVLMCTMKTVPRSTLHRPNFGSYLHSSTMWQTYQPCCVWHNVTHAVSLELSKVVENQANLDNPEKTIHTFNLQRTGRSSSGVWTLHTPHSLAMQNLIITLKTL